MSERWWRAYDDALNDPKVQSLPPSLFKFWFNLLCVASKHDGLIPSKEALKTLLRARLDHVETYLKELLNRGLIDETKDGLSPHNWRKRQYKSDNSTSRVKAHRDAKRNVSETPPEYRIQNTETETESKKDKNRSLSLLGGRDATRPTRDEDFENFWKAYPKRDGANPKQPARKLFLAALKAGTTAEEILAGARGCAVRDRDKIGTPYIPQAVKWLRDKRWTDYGPQSAVIAENLHGWTPGKRTADEIFAELEQGSQDDQGSQADRLEETSSVDANGGRVCDSQSGLFRH